MAEKYGSVVSLKIALVKEEGEIYADIFFFLLLLLLVLDNAGLAQLVVVNTLRSTST